MNPILTNKINNDSNYLLKGRDDLNTYLGDTMYTGNPDAVLRARDVKDLQDILVFCHAEEIPVTFCGSQTSMTGASVADSGLLISTEKMDHLISLDQIDENSACAICEPGIIVGELKRKAASSGWFYPPAPTSQDIARLGATISTNATGEDSYKYGSTRPYVEEIKVLLADGSRKIFERKKGDAIHDELNRAGYFLNSANPLDWFIGAEGTLGFIYESRVRLIKEPNGFFSMLVPFKDNQSALKFIVNIASEKKLRPRALEFIDHTALSFMKTHMSFPGRLSDYGSLVYLKQEFDHEDHKLSSMDKWLAEISKHTPEDLLSDIVFADTDGKKEAMRLWRHQIPLKINEEYRHYWASGGGKIGSDWWVPINKLLEMMDFVYLTGQKSNIPFLAFAHLGQGHPHVNYLCKTPEEKERAQILLLQCCQKAVTLGGGVSGEHGIGKIHRDYLPIQWDSSVIAKMRAIKAHFDPKWILGRGNIFNP